MSRQSFSPSTPPRSRTRTKLVKEAIEAGFHPGTGLYLCILDCLCYNVRFVKSVVYLLLCSWSSFSVILLYLKYM